ncbi:MAG: hypothetical protein V4642_08910 [Bacteroidota bacterium]
MRKYLLAFIILLLSVAPGKSQSDHSKSITISPLLLILPVLETTLEFKLEERSGVAGVFGIGSVWGVGVFEAGAQYNYYIAGDFRHGLQLGGEALYTHFSLADGSTTGKENGNIISVGPYIGYKYAANFGLTLNAQAGATTGFGSIILTGGPNNTAMKVTASGLLLNLNLGWSF